MPLPFALLAAGTALRVAGQYTANMKQAAAELENAQFYQDQADFAALATRRSENIARFQYSKLQGDQSTSYAASGVDSGSGSAATTIGGTVANAINELWAIKKKGEMDFKLARARGNRAQDTGEMLQSTGYNLVQSASLIAGDAATSGKWGTL